MLSHVAFVFPIVFHKVCRVVAVLVRMSVAPSRLLLPSFRTRDVPERSARAQLLDFDALDFLNLLEWLRSPRRNSREIWGARRRRNAVLMCLAYVPCVLQPVPRRRVIGRPSATEPCRRRRAIGSATRVLLLLAWVRDVLTSAAAAGFPWRR